MRIGSSSPVRLLLLAAVAVLGVSCGSEIVPIADPAPPGGSTVAGSSTLVGDPCSSDPQCPAGGSGAPACITAPEFQGGYCAVEACSAHGHDCPGDGVQSKCVVATVASVSANRCLRLCASDADCRAGYTCQAKMDAAAGAGHGQVQVCFPAGP